MQFADYFSVWEKAAATVYHRVIAVERDVTRWVADHPEVGPLLRQAVTVAEGLLTAYGMPAAVIPEATLAAKIIEGSLAQLAAVDATVQSGGPTPTVSGAGAA